MELLLEGPGIRLGVSQSTGAVTSLLDKARGREYILRGASLPPFRLLKEGEPEEAAYQFAFQQEDGGLSLNWYAEGATLTARIRLTDGGIAFRASLRNEQGSCVRAFEYPVLGPLQDYGEKGRFVHSYATGVLMRDPLHVVTENDGLRFAPYPESFSGASMQLMSYYEEGAGGLYIAANDPDAHQKWLNVFAEKGSLAVSHIAGYENVVPGCEIRMDYDFTVRFISGDGWQEPAEMYREWAKGQPWCAQGPARGRAKDGDWLRMQAGYCTFGINAGHDRSGWLKRYRKDIGTPGFHVLGPDWTNTPQTFGSGVPGDLCDWLPTRFNPDTLAAIRDNGDYFAPFEFDFLVGMNRSNPETLRPNLQRFPNPPLSHDKYHFSMLCPCSDFTKDLHRIRDVSVQRESGADAMYYDISANNLIKVCLDGGHGHPPGGGKAIADGYARVYADTSLALRAQAGKSIPLGTEMISEIYLQWLDFYQARAWAQPSSTLETWPFRDQMRSGRMEMIPLFDFVYHEYGAVRMDGWGKLVRETGDLFYHIAAKVYLWGGLYEINHEYSPMEELDGAENSGQEHYFCFDPQHCAYDQSRAEYVRRFAKMRMGIANRYLAYGRMVRQPAIDSPEIALGWYHYNHNQKDPSYKASGTYRVHAVLSSAFEDGQGGYALFLVNTDAVPQTIAFALSHSSLSLPDGPKPLALHWGFADASGAHTQDLGVLRDGESRQFSLTLDPRTPYMLEIK